jgi:hypothetical protein
MGCGGKIDIGVNFSQYFGFAPVVIPPGSIVILLLPTRSGND